jgi:flavin reductase (DIM6/NTAB) family NADH-FMN oxidoreductase RutF
MSGTGEGAERAAVHALVTEIDYPMFIVTAAAGGRRSGCLVGFTTQCSIHPPRFLVCISDKNHTFGVAREAETLVVHLVPETAAELAELFGSETGDEIDKFARCAWREGPDGAPILEDIGTWFAGRVLDRRPVGDHWAFLLAPFESAGEEGETPFTFHRARRIPPGHAP